MPLISLALPPGAYRNGTRYQSRGRYYDVNRVRWFGEALAPIGGWRLKTEETVVGAPRALIAWRDNSKVTWAAIGTHSGLYVMAKDGALESITPSGFVAGYAHSSLGGGFGSGPFGEGAFGAPRVDIEDTSDASVWTLDTRGQNLVGCLSEDGALYEWSPSAGGLAAEIANAPQADAVFVTAEGAVVALGADGNPRRVEFSDAEDDTLWTPDATNTAGGFNLQTYGSLKCGRRIRDGNLLFTDLDVWTMVPTRDVLVYGFEQVGMACGVVSKQAVAAIDEKAVWMAADGFWIFNGGVSPLPCEVRDKMFTDFNHWQGAKVCAVRNAQFSEVTWFYPSSDSIENNRYVTWNYQTGAWSFGALSRTCGTDKSVFAYPLLVEPLIDDENPDAVTGRIWEHEVGHSYPDGIAPYAEGGPIELGAGDMVMRVRGMVPDELTSGDVEVSFACRFHPNGDEMTTGPYVISPRTDLRFTARQVSVRYHGARAEDWRVGAVRLDVDAGGAR